MSVGETVGIPVAAQPDMPGTVMSVLALVGLVFIFCG